jgi:hypothetical protein
VAQSRIDIGPLRGGELVAGVASVVLVIGVFLPWFRFGSRATGYFSFSATALRTWMYLPCVISLGVVGCVVMKAMWHRRRAPVRYWPVLYWMALGGACSANLVLTVGCFVKKAQGLSWDVGAYLSLVAAAAALVGAAGAAVVGALAGRRGRVG